MSKGVTKNGETFCMSCGASVEHGASRCEACYSQLDHEVRAFKCPRCESVLELGTHQCEKCGMRFKVKSVRPSDAAEDERILEKLVSFGKRGAGMAAPEGQETAATGARGLSPEEQGATKDLVDRIARLAITRGELASEMSARLSRARDRLARMSRPAPGEFPADDIGAELKAVAEDLAGAEELTASAGQIAQDLLRALSFPGVEARSEGTDLASAAKGLAARPAGVTPTDLADREEQVRKREEMVDRKIKAYAQKKKQLEAMESSLAAGAPPGTASRAGPGTATEELADRVRSLHEIVSPDGACDDIEPCLSSLEGHLREAVAARSRLEQRAAQLEEGEEEVRRLLGALDNLLGQLPAEVIDRFSKSDEFRLYERVLDRLRI